MFESLASFDSDPSDRVSFGERVEPDPPMEAVIGHWLAPDGVHRVFAENDGRQYILVAETGERAHETYLRPDERWARRDPPCPFRGQERHSAEERAYHEAGHAVICVDEGIRVEYVTILKQTRTDGVTRLGWCQYDYHLTPALKRDPSSWAEKAAKATLGGPLADCMYRNQKGLEVPEAVCYAWKADISDAKWHLASIRAQESGGADLDAEVRRLIGCVEERLREEWAWAAVSSIANLLCDEGAICGQVVHDLVERAKEATT